MRITKIISITSLAALLPLSFTANALSWMPGNFIAGVEVGSASQSSNLDSTEFVLSGAPVAGQHSEHISDSGTVYGAMLGYQVVCRCMVLGLEGHAHLGYDGKAHNFPVTVLAPASANVWYHRDLAYGISARIGYKVPPCFTPYIRIGTQANKDHLSITYTGLTSTPAFDHFSDEKTLWTWFWGAGIEVPLFSKRTSIRVEYDYLPARHFDMVDSGAPLTVKHKYSPHGHTAKVQWVWNFC